ncbi:MAG: hypothetical protein KF729_06790 [Sandaracinaceae bacterium]|nr:hypothetical protein [Sandaracinaceae bacterium]
MRPPSATAATVALLLGACVPAPLDLGGRACPCVEGWWCDESTRTCVEGAAPDGGLDAAMPDAAMPDAAMPDAAMPDAAMLDAAMPDAAMLDAATDAGADAGVADGGTDAGPPASECAGRHAGALFCDGFEDLPLAAWSGVFGDGGASARTGTRSRLGAGALRAASTRAGGYTGAFSNSPGGLASGELYLRAYYYVPSAQVIDGGISLMQLGQDDAPYHHVGLSVDIGERSSMFMRIGAGTAYREGSTFPRNRWVCLELHVTVSSSGGVIEYFMDGTRQGRATDLDTIPTGGYRQFTVGLPYSGIAQSPIEVFVDDVVFDVAPIGCD